LGLALPHASQRALRSLLLAYAASVVCTAVILLVLSDCEHGFRYAHLSLL
jgi:hypothetical protein